MIYFCCDNTKRRNEVKAHPTVNGIDFLEVLDDHNDPFSERQRTLFVHFIDKETVEGRQSLADLLSNLKPENVRIEGGERIRDISVTSVSSAVSSPPSSPPQPSDVLTVRVSQAGDFSPYVLRFVRSADISQPPDNLDIVLSAVSFSFKVACASPFDCKTPRICPDTPKTEPEIDYLAKDYASFRQLMLDRMAVLAPGWTERNPSDLGITLVELLAYVGDYLSYQQDAVATESYLGSARRRASVRRHARLVDYPMHDGRNARVWVQVAVEAASVNLKKGTQLFTRVPKIATRIAPASGSPPVTSFEYDQAINAGAVVFETMEPAALHQANNEMHFYTWGDERCCLPKGATRATLIVSNDGGLIDLKAGDVLIFIEKRNPENGNEDEADPRHRHAVRLTEVQSGTDSLFKEPGTSQDLRILDIEWATADALPFALCLWDVNVEGQSDKVPASVALGNIVLADHGQTIADEPLPTVPGNIAALTKVQPRTESACTKQAIVPTAPRYRPQLKRTPVTQSAPYDPAKLPLSATATTSLFIDDPLRLPAPQVRLREAGVEGDWEARRDLLNSDPQDKAFVVEVEADGAAFLRFGDGQLGLRPAAGTELLATYRVGNGTVGNIGANALAHIVTDVAAIKENGVTNFMPAEGGLNAETIEEVRQRAPSAFRRQERAVTEADYQELATRRDVVESCDLDVQRAAATLRWTGSWYTMFLTIDRLKGQEVDRPFETKLRNCMERFRMAGEDLEVDGPQYVSLEIVMGVCVKTGYFFSDVVRELLDVFSNRVLPDGRIGVFHPDNFSFGQPVFKSSLIATAQAVTGVESVDIKKFQRQGIDSNEALLSGSLTLGRLEIARLDNDRNFPERGVFTLERG